MGILDDLLSNSLGAGAPSPEGSRSLVEGLLEMLSSPDQSGGIGGLSQGFQRRGQGSLVSSWIATGRNEPLSPELVQQVLGAERVSSLSRRAGVSDDIGAGAIATLLPEVVNQLTPEGNVPERSAMSELGKKLLAGLVVGGAAAAATAAIRSRMASAEPQSSGGARPRADFSDVQAGSSTRPAEPEPEPEIYTVVSGDSLSKIAQRLYGNANQWRQIFDANRDQIKNPDLIHPGQKLRIPRPEGGKQS